jgi:hypothetical protein
MRAATRCMQPARGGRKTGEGVEGWGLQGGGWKTACSLHMKLCLQGVVHCLPLHFLGQVCMCCEHQAADVPRQSQQQQRQRCMLVRMMQCTAQLG